jgi:PAS domain S-box-containing protein
LLANDPGREALLKAGAALQSAIFNSADFSSIATDAKGVIQIFNVGAERMLGYTAAEVMNKITPADISDPQEVIARAKALSVELGESWSEDPRTNPACTGTSSGREWWLVKRFAAGPTCADPPTPQPRVAEAQFSVSVRRVSASCFRRSHHPRGCRHDHRGRRMIFNPPGEL